MSGTGMNLPRSSGSLRRYSHSRSPVVASMRLNEVARVREVHHAVVDERRAFLRCRAHAARPHHPQLRDVAAVDLVRAGCSPSCRACGATSASRPGSGFCSIASVTGTKGAAAGAARCACSARQQRAAAMERGRHDEQPGRPEAGSRKPRPHRVPRGRRTPTWCPGRGCTAARWRRRDGPRPSTVPWAGRRRGAAADSAA